MKLEHLETNSEGDRLLPLETSDSVVICKVLNASQTYFVCPLVDGPGYFDQQSKRYLTKEKHLMGGEDWERKGGKYVQGRDAAMKVYKEMCDPAAAARQEKDEYYSNKT
jgi:hypothetical protein